MKTAQTSTARAPIGRATFAPHVAAAPLSTVGLIVSAPSLLEVMQAMDGAKEARYNVMLDALTLAYTQALTHGDKRQLKAVLDSTGRGKCVKAMRSAVQTVGVLGLHKDADTRADAIASAVATASTVFADACLTVVKRAPASKAVKASEKVAGKGEGEGATPAPATPAQSVDSGVVCAYARTLADDELSALLDSLAVIVSERASVRMPLLKAA